MGQSSVSCMPQRSVSKTQTGIVRLLFHAPSSGSSLTCGRAHGRVRVCAREEGEHAGTQGTRGTRGTRGTPDLVAIVGHGQGRGQSKAC